MATPEMLQDLADQLAHPGDDQGYQVIASAVICSVVSILAVVLRLYARGLTKSGLGKDDYMMLLALGFHIGFNIAASTAVKYGLGRHVVFVTDPYHLGVCVISAEVLISFVIPAAETSVLLLYHRLFPQKNFRTWLWVVGFLVWSTKVAFIVVTLKQCTPIAKVWTPTMPGYCLTYWEVSLIATVLNIITDFIVLLMPVPLVWRLKLSKKQRLQLIFAFTFGSFTCIAGIVRTFYTPGLAKFDVSWGLTGLAVTCVVEGCLFVISGCIPTYVALLTHWNQRFKNHYQLPLSDISKQSHGTGSSSFTASPEEKGKVMITTDISTTFEGKDQARK